MAAAGGGYINGCFVDGRIEAGVTLRQRFEGRLIANEVLHEL
jgi:hypothetical protein